MLRQARAFQAHRFVRSFASKLGKPASASQQRLMDLERRYGAHNYAPIEVVLERGEGVHVWDVDGKRYIDCLSAYSAVNQGHCHPHIISAMNKQAEKITLTSRAFFNSELPETLQYITDLVGYDRALFMNTGVEAVETALKLARKWAYEVKGVPSNQAKLLFCDDNFMGRTLGVVSASTDENAKENFGPYLPGMQTIPYNNVDALRAALSADPTICAFTFEPIQGEAGVIIPDEGYLQAVRDVTREFGVLMIADEVQTGLCRTGDMLAINHENIQADIVTMGKALSGGVLPVSCVVASDEVMGTLKPGQHGSTFGGNPLACAVARASLEVLVNEDLAGRSREMGARFIQQLRDLNSPVLTDVRGRGLMMAIDVSPMEDRDAHDLCYIMRDHGVLAKQTHDNTVRLAPPLIITESQVDEAVECISRALDVYRS